MPTLLEMCEAIAPHSKMTVEELLEYSKGSNSVESSLRIGEITAAYLTVDTMGVKYEHTPLNFRPGIYGKKFMVGK